MYARLTTIVAESDISGSAPGFLQNALPTIEALAGYKGLLLLKGNGGRVVVGLTFWETEDAMRESERITGPIRKVETAGLAYTSLETATFEVMTLQLS